MYAQVGKSKENQSKAVANSIVQKKSKGEQFFRFVDNRPETIAQMKSKEKAVLQRKAGNIPQANVLTKQASEGVFGGGNYESVIASVKEYHNNGIIPNNDYGKQIVQIEKIATRIGNWEGKHGPTNQAVRSGFFGLSKQDKRRQVLNNLKTQIPIEDAAVRPQGLESANQQHQQARTALSQYVQNGVQSNDRRLKNSCEWIQAGKTILYAVTPTGDSYARLTKAGKNPQTDEAFFPEGVFGSPGNINSAAVSYNKDNLLDNTNVTLTKTKRTGGWNDPGSPGLIAVVNPSDNSQGTVWKTLRHEVQHDADKHKNRDALSDYRVGTEGAEVIFGDPDVQNLNAPDPIIKNQSVHNLLAKYGNALSIEAAISQGSKATKAAAAEVSLSKYKTEYRAYSYQEGDGGGPYSNLDNTVQNQNHDGYMFTERQLAIFKHIYGGYEYTGSGWDNNPTLADGVTTFRDAVANYWNPDTEAFNKYNSVRVDDFYQALDALGTKEAATALEQQHGLDVAPVNAKESDPNSPQVKGLINAIQPLDKNDLDYIIYESPAMTRKIQAHIEGAALQKIESELQESETCYAIASLFD